MCNTVVLRKFCCSYTESLKKGAVLGEKNLSNNKICIREAEKNFKTNYYWQCTPIKESEQVREYGKQSNFEFPSKRTFLERCTLRKVNRSLYSRNTVYFQEGTSEKLYVSEYRFYS